MSCNKKSESVLRRVLPAPCIWEASARRCTTTFFARQHGGDFILRIEDTDSHRFVPGAESYIMESLKWCGITIDEGHQRGRPSRPVPPERAQRDLPEIRLATGRIGRRLLRFRHARRTERDPRGSRSSRQNVRVQLRSAHPAGHVAGPVGREEVKRRIAAGDQWVIRFKMPENEEVRMHDLIRGDVTVHTSTLDDKVLYKSADALPTYHLANIVDDHLMEISHDSRRRVAAVAAVALLAVPRARLERHAARIRPPAAAAETYRRRQAEQARRRQDGIPGIPAAMDVARRRTSHGYREDGYFPEAFVNMLALLGWNPGNRPRRSSRWTN